MLMFCCKCRKDIKQYGVVAEVVYDHVCSYYSEKKRALIMSQKQSDGICVRKPVIDFLERKGFLVTTEVGIGDLAIKPVGTCNKIRNVNYFCCGRH